MKVPGRTDMTSLPSAIISSVALPLTKMAMRDPQASESGRKFQKSPGSRCILSACSPTARTAGSLAGSLILSAERGKPRSTCARRLSSRHAKPSRMPSSLCRFSARRKASAGISMICPSVIARAVTMRVSKSPRTSGSPSTPPGVSLPTRVPARDSRSRQPSSSTIIELAKSPALAMTVPDSNSVLSWWAATARRNSSGHPSRSGVAASAGTATSVSQRWRR
mmetsp:Transcript_26659/g.70382  ORF Transcript_26659/g.70382 Transcript_26659/m.70382 type:complete len:222 (-) Transcript_26659:672-1337(-)